MYDHSSTVCEQRVLRALRQVIRSVDLYSRKLFSEYGLTTPQLLCLHTLAKSEQMTLTELARTVNLSISTVNGIMDRLEAKGCLTRVKSREDRRKIYIQITVDGMALIAQAPSLLHDKLSLSLARLPESEQMAITLSLERIVELMETDDIESFTYMFSSDQATPSV